MANTKLIQNRIDAVKMTMKITNAMYLISSSKVKQARGRFDSSKDYFFSIQHTIHSILRHTPEIEHEYFDDRRQKGENRRKAYIVVTADKGLAGAYNQTIEHFVEEKMRDAPNALLFVVGEVGRRYFAKHGASMQEGFHYSAQTPSLQRARNITSDVIDLYQDGIIDEVSIIHTRMVSTMQNKAHEIELLPLHYGDFKLGTQTHRPLEETNFYPSEPAVLSQIVPIYIHGVIFGALTESYCAEQNARMLSMDASTQNAKKIIADLTLQYNRARQGKITQEITEIIGGAAASSGNGEDYDQ